MDIERIDHNLLVVFSTIFSEGGITPAGKKLHSSGLETLSLGYSSKIRWRRSRLAKVFFPTLSYEHPQGYV